MLKFIFRFDDIAPTMNFKRFNLFKSLFLKYQIPVVLGVIPKCKNRNLTFENRPDENFVQELKIFESLGWEIAQHGYTHELLAKNGGIMKRNAASEFAGLPYQEQFERIKKGKMILNSWGFSPKTFIAPWHSFDKSTILAIKANDFSIISDGIELYPYLYKKILFVPQIWWDAPPANKKIKSGIYTICLHPNTTSDERIKVLADFIKNLPKNQVLTCKTAKEWYLKQNLKKRTFFQTVNSIFKIRQQIKKIS